MDSTDPTKLNVSLEPHLLEVLSPLPSLLPATLAEELRAYIVGASKDFVPYSTLLAISQWSRTPEGAKKLEKQSPPLKSSSYMMVSLLAGVKTSPERFFGSYTPPPEPEKIAERQKRERQELTAIINALLSVFGVGFATWWAADRLHWKEQWRVLLAFAAAAIVAIAEGVLYILWSSRRSTIDAHRKYRLSARAARHKKADDDACEADETRINVQPQPSLEQSKSPNSNLRQRRL